MASKQQLHDLIDNLPDARVDMVYRAVLAIADDEPISPEIERRILDAVAEVDAGAKCYTTEELNRELGL